MRKKLLQQMVGHHTKLTEKQSTELRNEFVKVKNCDLQGLFKVSKFGHIIQTTNLET